MQKKVVIMLTFFFSLIIGGCRWQDDFRSRIQPQYGELPPRGTLNPDSIDYQGDPLKKEEEEKKSPLPAIDKLSTIPPVPEYPAGVDVKE